jgi:sugar/nucleoside kinase (ribokinase family)
VDLSADAVIFNFISGRDVKLPHLKAFRKKYSGLIYCDYHSLSLGFGKNRRRYYRLHPRYKEYLQTADFTQMNLNELGSIYLKPLFGESAIARACGRLHEFGAGKLIITAGGAGVFVSDPERGRIFRVPAVNLLREVDPTGCGDALGAALVVRFLQTGDLVKTVEFANHFAAAKAMFSGLDGFANIKSILRKIGPAPRMTTLEKIAP